MIRELLDRVPLFNNLTETDFGRICGMIEEIELEEGEELFAEGSPGDSAYIIAEGKLDIVKEAEGRDVLLAVRGPGEVIGEMSLLEQAPRMATVRARTDVRLAVITKQQFEDLLNSSPSAARRMLDVVMGRLRETEALLRQNEKMAQLGMLVAGIAHELNNPAAAVKRGAEYLRETTTELEAVHQRLADCVFDEPQRELIDRLKGTIEARPVPIEQLNALELSDRESDLLDKLEDSGLEDAWKLVPTLVEIGIEPETLDDLVEHFPPDQLHTVLEWLVARYSADRLMDELGQGAGQISEIVKALKSYTYLDRGPVQKVDIHEGLENTLIILRSKLKKVRVNREYARDLPTIEGYGSELNQVWTNLIDNAIDALDGEGEITIRTRQADGGVEVEIEDNGPGIPEDIQPHIFEPFFTTKPQGKGTGMGLDISHNIVTLKHGGEITFESEPGRTVFRVWLPLLVEET